MLEQATPRPYKHEGREIIGAELTPRAKVIALGAHGSISSARPIEIGDSDWTQTMHDLAFLCHAAMQYDRLKAIEQKAGELVELLDSVADVYDELAVAEKTRELAKLVKKGE